MCEKYPTGKGKRLLGQFLLKIRTFLPQGASKDAKSQQNGEKSC
jgi:hypothetical protein